MTSFAQKELIKKINLYLESKHRMSQMKEGGCHGLTLLWLHHMSHEDELSFYATVEEIVRADASYFVSQESKLERFISHVIALQKPEVYDKNISQLDIDRMLEMPQKKTLSGVFNYRDLLPLFQKTFEEDTLICLSGPDHTIGIYRRKNDLYLYDPNFLEGRARLFIDFKALSQQIVHSLYSLMNHSVHTFALIINILSKRPFDNTINWAKDLTDSCAKTQRQDSFGDTALHLAGQNNDKPLVERLLAKMPFVNLVNKKQENALAHVASYGYVDIAETMLSHGINPNQVCKDGNTALHHAADQGHVDMIGLLLKPCYKMRVDLQNHNKETPLFLALVNNYIESAKQLMKAGAEVCLRDDIEHSPLHVALAQKKWGFVLLFLTVYQTPESIPATLMKSLKEAQSSLIDALPRHELMLGEELSLQLNILMIAMQKTSSSCATALLQKGLFAQTQRLAVAHDEENAITSSRHLIS